jgi:Ca-activated chloride channel family protein
MQRRLIGISVSLLLFAVALVSQSPADQTAITGKIMDQTGAVIPNATITLKHVPTGKVSAGASSATGSYIIANLAAGEYSLRAEVPGFKAYLREKIALAEKQTLRIDIVLEVGATTDSIVVSADSTLLKTDSSAVTYNITLEQMKNLPSFDVGAANGAALRDPYAVAQMLPGVQYNRENPVMLINGLPQGEIQYRMDGQVSGLIRGGTAPGTEQYGRYVENDFTTPQDNPLSTFATDVDTASYSNVRRFLINGQLPPADAVRIEELVNYFRYEYPVPEAGKPVSMTTHVMKSPWNPGRLLLHVGMRTAPVAAEDLPPSHFTFLIDVSGSMAPPERLPLVKQALQMLTRQLRPQDTVAIVVYAGEAGVTLPPTRGDRQQEILGAVGRLNAGGSTNGAGGIRLAYQLARQAFDKKANNRVILATDGDFNVGVTSDDELVRVIEQERKTGVFLSILGVGSGNLKDAKMEKLADFGNGNYAYLDSLREARKVLVQEMGATLVTVAKDVKVQIEFNPARVKEYRLVGYENRLLRAEDFNNDAKDAGDLGSGHQVTAFYEIVPAGGSESGGEVDELRYQQQRGRTKAPVNRAPDRANELAWLKLRHKTPQGDKSELLEWPVNARVEEFGSAPRDVRFAAAVAEYGLLLRQSKFAGNASFDHVLATANETMGRDLDGDRAEFVDLARRAANLSGAVISRR